MHQARQQDTSVIKSGYEWKERSTKEVSVEVIPFKASPAGTRYFLLFKETPPQPPVCCTGCYSGEAKAKKHKTDKQ